jgi:hypothetical protein
MQGNEASEVPRRCFRGRVCKLQIWLLITPSESEDLVEPDAQSIQHHL